MQNKENLPTEPGSTIGVWREAGEYRLYVLAFTGVWKPMDMSVGYGLPPEDSAQWFPLD